MYLLCILYLWLFKNEALADLAGLNTEENPFSEERAGVLQDAGKRRLHPDNVRSH